MSIADCVHPINDQVSVERQCFPRHITALDLGGPLKVARFAEGPFGPRPGRAQGDPLGAVGALLLPSRQWCYIRHQSPSPPPIRTIVACLGRVNGVPFDGRMPGLPAFPAGTLLMIRRPEWTKLRNVTGRVCWTLRFYFDDRGEGWDRLPAPDGLAYQVAPEPFKAADFFELFAP